MKSIAYISILTFLIACQPKKETTQKESTTDSIPTATTAIQNEENEAITFGFSNQPGTQILAFEENVNPKICTQIVDSKGEITPISFLKTQKGNEKGINLVPQNIDNCMGHLCEVKGGSKANSENTVVIFNYAFAKKHKPVLLKNFEVPQSIDDKTKKIIANDRKRAVKNAWKIANLDKQSAYIVIFEQKQDSVLASLVIVGEELIYRDYPAKYDEGSTWRVDDGGEFPKDAIKILAVFRNQADELEIITEWAGAEGANIEYAKANKNKFETIKEASRYWGAL